MKRKKEPAPPASETEHENRIVVFQEKEIRRTWHNDEWWFVVEDVVSVLTDSNDPKQYIRRMRSRDESLAAGWVQIVLTLPVETVGGTQRMNCSNTEGLFRIIQSMPSPKAEPFRRWLAKVGAERVQEIENPELAAERARALYREKGYSEEWIDARMKSVDIRQQLTNEWKGRGVQEGIEYSILTAEISRATFGMTPSEYKAFKSLKTENLRDHMTNLELIFTMLGEESTRVLAVAENAQGFEKNRDAAQQGGAAAGAARENFEVKMGQPVSTPDNFKQQIQASKKRKQLPDGDLPTIDAGPIG